MITSITLSRLRYNQQNTFPLKVGQEAPDNRGKIESIAIVGGVVTTVVFHFEGKPHTWKVPYERVQDWEEA